MTTLRKKTSHLSDEEIGGNDELSGSIHINLLPPDVAEFLNFNDVGTMLPSLQDKDIF